MNTHKTNKQKKKRKEPNTHKVCWKEVSVFLRNKTTERLTHKLHIHSHTHARTHTRTHARSHQLRPTNCSSSGHLSSLTLTLEMISGVLKSRPPTSRKPQGEGPHSVTLCVISPQELLLSPSQLWSAWSFRQKRRKEGGKSPPPAALSLKKLPL